MTDIKQRIKEEIKTLEVARSKHETSRIDLRINALQAEMNQLNQERSTRQEAVRLYDERIANYNNVLLSIESLEVSDEPVIEIEEDIL